MQKQKTGNGSKSNAVRVIGAGSSLHDLRHLRSASRNLRETGEICRCHICTKRLAGIGSYITPQPEQPKDGNVPDSRADSKEPDTLPPTSQWADYNTNS